MNWACGLTTVPARKTTHLPRTLESLKAAGFLCLRLFVDGCKDPGEYAPFGLEVTTHYPSMRTSGNWMLALAELYLRDPHANRFAIFQDDFVTYRNLRSYLDRSPYPGRGYWNLYTFPENQALSKGRRGWYPSNQLGKGAVGLVFNNEAARLLLGHQRMIDRMLNPERGWQFIDGGIVEAMKEAGWVEYVHNPSLVQHTGIVSSMGKKRHALANSFRGEEFNAEELPCG